MTTGAAEFYCHFQPARERDATGPSKGVREGVRYWECDLNSHYG